MHSWKSQQWLKLKRWKAVQQFRGHNKVPKTENLIGLKGCIMCNKEPAQLQTCWNQVERSQNYVRMWYFTARRPFVVFCISRKQEKLRQSTETWRNQSLRLWQNVLHLLCTDLNLQETMFNPPSTAHHSTASMLYLLYYFEFSVLRESTSLNAWVEFCNHVLFSRKMTLSRTLDRNNDLDVDLKLLCSINQSYDDVIHKTLS